MSPAWKALQAAGNDRSKLLARMDRRRLVSRGAGPLVSRTEQAWADWSPSLADVTPKIRSWSAFTSAVPTFPSTQMHPAPGIESVKGYSDQKMLDAWAGAIDQYAAAFPEQCVHPIDQRSTPREPLPCQNHRPRSRQVRSANDAPAQRPEGRYPTPRSAPPRDRQQHRRGVRVGFEMVSAAANNPTPFGSPDVMDGVKIGKATAERTLTFTRPTYRIYAKTSISKRRSESLATTLVPLNRETFHSERRIHDAWLQRSVVYSAVRPSRVV